MATNGCCCCCSDCNGWSIATSAPMADLTGRFCPGCCCSPEEEEDEVKIKQPKICDLSCRRIKPVAWLVLVGDTLHNFADGLALGAAVAQSISLGLSTMVALIFHELPHELGEDK